MSFTSKANHPKLQNRSMSVEREYPLHAAVKSANLQQIQFLLNKGLNIDELDDYGNSPIYLGAYYGHNQVVEFLLNYGADPDREIISLALQNASNDGKLDMVKCLVKHGANVNKENSYGTCALYSAAYKNQFEVAAFLIENGAHVNSTELDKDDYSILHVACHVGALKIVKLLIENGAHINKTDSKKRTSLFITSDDTICKYLVENGADINKSNNDGWTPLLMAIDNKKYDIAETLIKNGADVNKHAKDQSSPLYLAVMHGSSDLVQLLLTKGANLKTGDDDKVWSPLFVSIYYGNIEVAKVLLKNGADVNQITNNISFLSPLESEEDGEEKQTYSNKETPLHIAINENRLDFVKLFIENGAQINKRDSRGSTPLFKACLNNSKGRVDYLVLDYLIEEGADFSLVLFENNMKQRPIDVFDYKRLIGLQQAWSIGNHHFQSRNKRKTIKIMMMIYSRNNNPLSKLPRDVLFYVFNKYTCLA